MNWLSCFGEIYVLKRIQSDIIAKLIEPQKNLYERNYSVLEILLKGLYD